MEFKIKLLDIQDAVACQQVADLINVTFNHTWTWEKIFLNTYYNNSIAGSPASFYVVAYFEDKLVGFVAYKSHDFIQNGQVVNCFHHCIVCTSKAYRGNNIFQKILAFGKAHLKQLGAAFVYGIPNHHSGPVFKKLNYSYLGPFVKVNVPNIPVLFERAFSPWEQSDVLYNTNAFYQNDYQLIDAKQQELGKEIIIVEDLGNVIWGRIIKKKLAAVTISYFYVGGMIVNKPHFFKNIVKKLFGKHKVSFVQFIFHNTSDFKKLFRNPKPAPYVEPFFAQEINQPIATETVFNFMPGIKNNF